MNITDMHDTHPLYKKVTIVSAKEEIKGFKTFVLEADDKNTFTYQAGQYITLVHQGGEEEVRRSYSFTSAPLLGEPMTIGVKRIENGFFSRRLVDSAQPGDVLTTTGAGGRFILPQDMQPIQQVLFFAAGSGITPVLSLIKTILHLHPQVRVLLVFSNASPQKALFLSDLQHLQRQFSHVFTIEYLFSNNPDLGRARLHRDLLLHLLHAFITVPFDRALFYICGPESYMRLCSYVLQEASVPAGQIKKENFAAQQKKPAPKLPPDTASHQVHLQLGGDRFSFTTHYPDTILKAAKKEGIVLPYSCEIGRCGNCLARCTGGKVWHSYNEVLTDSELAEGLVLTCVAHPVGGDVHLSIG